MSTLTIALGQPAAPAPSWEYAFFYWQTATSFLWVSDGYTLSRFDETGLTTFADELADHYEVPDAVRGEGLSTVRVLNIVGYVGWELVSVKMDGTTTLFYFKRPR